jgi:ABC-type polysaccharide/polyol phosphate export permease
MIADPNFQACGGGGIKIHMADMNRTAGFKKNTLKLPIDWLEFSWIRSMESLKSQYGRTRLGPFWLVITQFVMIFGIGLVFFTIFNQPFGQFILYVSAGIIGWNFISTTITTSSNSFVTQGSLIQSFNIPYSVIPLTALLNSAFVFVHGLVVHFTLMLILGVPFGFLPLLVVSVVIVATILYPAIFVLGVLGARYRDLGPLIGSIMYLSFLVTPVIWDRANIANRMAFVVELNPFYHMLELLRRPMLGAFPSTTSILVCLGMAAASLILGELFVRRFARPLPFWV